VKIAIGSDHAGFLYKEQIVEYLKKNNFQVQDFGTYSDEPVDYPDFVRPVAEVVTKRECDYGIVLGGSGNGEAIVANKVHGVRCTLCWDIQTAYWARAHNDANVLAIGQRTIPIERAIAIVETWLRTPFEGGRHLRRIQKIE